MSKTEDNIAWSNQKLLIRWTRITSIQVFSIDYELTVFTITFRSHIYSHQWLNQLASDDPQVYGISCSSFR